jgi:hypothetical protein
MLLDGSWRHALDRSGMAFFYDVILHKRHGKWVASWHISMDAVDVYKKKLILKIGCVNGDALIKERNMSTLKLHDKNFTLSLF